MKREDVILFSGGAQGAEAEFGASAERWVAELLDSGKTAIEHQAEAGLYAE